MQATFEWMDKAPWYQLLLLLVVPVMIMSGIRALSIVMIPKQISREEEQQLAEWRRRGELTDAEYKARRYPQPRTKKGA